MVDWLSAMNDLSKGNFAPVYVLVGTEPYLIHAFISELVTKQADAEGELFSAQTYNFEDGGCDAAVLACQSVGLFGTDGVVTLRNVVSLSTAQSKTKHDTDMLEAYLESPFPEKTLVLTVLAEKLDERKKIVKALKAFPLINCNTPKTPEATKVLARFCKNREIAIDASALAEVWRRTASISIAVSELEKAAVYANSSAVTKADVEEIVTMPPDDNIFHWIDAVVMGRVHEAFDAMTHLYRENDGFGLLALVARQVRLMYLAKHLGAKGRTEQDIAQAAGAHPFAVKVAAEQARKLKESWLTQLLMTIADAEFLVKTGKLDIEHAVTWVVMSCARNEPPLVRAT